MLWNEERFVWLTCGEGALVEDDPNDPRTWDEARRRYGESDSEDEDNHEEVIREMMVRY